MKSCLFSLLFIAAIAGNALAAPAQPLAPKGLDTASAAASRLPSARELFGDVIQSASQFGGFLGGPQVACRAECIETKEVCGRECELWNENGTCGKWSAERVCREKCVRWSSC